MVSGNQQATGGFTAGGVATGSGGFSSGTTVTTTTGGAAGGYTIGADRSVRDARGVVIGTMSANGDVVNSAGQVVLRGLNATGGTVGGVTSGGGFTTGASDPLGGITTGGVSAGDFSVRSDGSVVNSNGSVIGRVNANGEIVANGVVIGRVRPGN